MESDLLNKKCRLRISEEKEEVKVVKVFGNNES
jgi:hypothetical protein